MRQIEEFIVGEDYKFLQLTHQRLSEDDLKHLDEFADIWDFLKTYKEEQFYTLLNKQLEAVLKSLKIFVKHDLCEGQLDHSLGRVCQKLIVDGQASEVLQPGERTLHNPSFG